MQKEVITLDYFYDYDPTPNVKGSQYRFLCPFCGDSKDRDNRHRCMGVNTDLGVYHCWRGGCEVSGKLNIHATQKLYTEEEFQKIEADKKRRLADAARQEAEDRFFYVENLERVGDIKGKGIAYLKKRGIPLEFAKLNQVRYSSDFYGSPAIIFPMRNKERKLKGMNARYVNDGRTVEHRTVGAKLATCYTTKGALTAPILTICEAPFDALSLALAGYPAMATCGSGFPLFIPGAIMPHIGYVNIATDADENGDKVAIVIAEKLKEKGIVCFRVRSEGFKDWNKVHTEIGIEAVKEQMLNMLTI